MLNGYVAVGNKCAVDFSEFNLPLTRQESLDTLWRIGFRVIEVDLVEQARRCIGQSKYRRGAAYYLAPFVMDCTTFSKWVYAQAGIWLPRHSIDQRELGRVVAVDQIESGDLVFTAGRVSYWYSDPTDGVGHVGIATGQGSIIHAANSKRHVVEDSFNEFIGPEANFRSVRRIKTKTTITLESPSNRVVEWSGEFRNILAQNLSLKDEVL